MATPPPPPSLTRPSPSFRLRSPSLNTLRLRRVFDLFDHNHDGSLTLQELAHALNRLGLDAEPSGLHPTVSSHIKPGKSGLDFDDFHALHRSIGDELFGDIGKEEAAEAEEEDLMEAFRVFDENGDGFISSKELQVVLGKLGLVEGEEIGRVEAMICLVDRNEDGMVDFCEFKVMMKGFVSVQKC